MLNTLNLEFRIIFKRHPAARNWLEVLFCYPGRLALLRHRLAHWLYCLGIPFIPRSICDLRPFFTGIEIRPGATIGLGVLTHHAGAVTGETAIAADNALIYQGVPQGGTGKETGLSHPTPGDNVVERAGAAVLGNIPIGNNVPIGAGSTVLQDIPSGCTVVGVPGSTVRHRGQPVGCLARENLPDLEAPTSHILFYRIKFLAREIGRWQSEFWLASVTSAESQAHNLPTHCYFTREQFINGAGV